MSVCRDIVYILFGTEPRSDGSNIIGIYYSVKAAERAQEFWEERLQDLLHIEKHDVWEE